LAAALAAWGHAQRAQQMSSTSPAEDRAQATALSARAGMLDPDNAMVLTARSVVHAVADERDEAGELVARALARNPRLAWAWERRGWLRAFSGDMTAATACFGRALRLDPATPAKATLLCGFSAGLFDRGRYDLAARWMRRALSVEPGATWINRTLAVAYARIGEHRAATDSLTALRRYRPDIRVRDVTSAMHFSADFMSRIANGLGDLGLPP
jgi:tetratricopeptide (TPR) repeat protein